MTFIDLFAGIGGFRKGMELAGHKCVGFCEWDKFAAASYTSMHLITEEQRNKLAGMSLKERQKEILKDEYRNGEWYSPDIRQVGAGNVPRVDCWCFGAPCLVAGTLITTKEGMKPIEEVRLGDMVLTHANTFEPVTERMINQKKGIYTLSVMGSPKTEVTGNHRFYVRYRKKIWDSQNRNYKIKWTEPEWKAVENFTGDEYIEFPNQKDEAVNYYDLSSEEAWLLGRYIADGYLQCTPRKNRPLPMKRIILCVGKAKLQEFEAKVKGHHFYKTYTNSCYKVQFYDEKLYKLCENCGRGAENKHIPGIIMALPKHLLKELIEGYMSGDGSCKNGKFRATSISKVLIYQLGQCISKIYDCGYSIHFCKRPNKYTICGREVNQKNTWELVYHIDHRKSLAYVIDGVLWQPLRKMTYEPEREETVYNLEVNNEHSYTANNMGLHNCQDFSIAGKRAGLDGDRSSLVREVFRVLSELEEKDRPEWLIYENVKGMLSSNRGGDFLSIILAMEELGYDISWQVFNSKYHGVPQNRERVYTLGHLRRYGERKVFPLCGADEENTIHKVEQIAQQNSTHRKNLNQYRVYDIKGLSPCLNKMDGGGREPHTAIPMCIDPQGRTSKEVKPSDTVPTLRAQAHGNNPEICIPVLTPDRAEKRQNGRRFKDNGEEAFTLTAQDRHGVAISEVNGVPVIWYEKYNCYIAIRKLTPKECFRLQGWSDDYFEKAQFVNSDSQLYKQAGNGVTVNVVEDIARAIGECE